MWLPCDEGKTAGRWTVVRGPGAGLTGPRGKVCGRQRAGLLCWLRGERFLLGGKAEHSGSETTFPQEGLLARWDRGWHQECG